MGIFFNSLLSLLKDSFIFSKKSKDRLRGLLGAQELTADQDWH